jgi:hypothetical protein
MEDSNEPYVGSSIQDDSPQDSIASERVSFKLSLERLINSYSQENGSNTPDFILAEYMENCLKNFNETVNNRELWYGRKDNKPIY